jgi:hypothetical protein
MSRCSVLLSTIILLTILSGIVVLSVSQTNPVPTPFPTTLISPTAEPTIDPATIALVGNQRLSFPVGASDILSLWLHPYVTAGSIIFTIEDLPPGFTYDFISRPAPWNASFLIKANDAAPGNYMFYVLVTVDDRLNLKKPIFVTITPCNDTPSGQFTQSVASNIVLVIRAGKPDWSDGFLVPILICKHDQPARVTVTLIKAVSEAQTPMPMTPVLVLYRSLVYPAPSAIDAHNSPNVDPDFPPIYNDQTGGQLQANTPPGLYLLIFLRDGYPGITDPKQRLAEVTYSIEIEPAGSSDSTMR